MQEKTLQHLSININKSQTDVDITQTNNQQNQQQSINTQQQQNPIEQSTVEEHTQIMNKDRHMNINKKRCIIVLSLFFFLFVAIFYLRNEKKNQLYDVQNRDYMGQLFGKFQGIVLDIGQLDRNQLELYSYRFEDGSQIISKNYLQKKLEKKLDENKIEKQLSKRISFELHSFQYDESLQINLDEKIKNEEKVSFNEVKVNNILNQPYNLALQQIQNNNSLSNKEFLANQYIYADKRYKIGSISSKQEIPVCIFSQGLSVSQQKMQRYLNSIQNLNYTNFHVVYVNQFTINLSFQNIQTFLSQSHMRIKNRIKIINNLQFLGTLANTYFWIKRFCGEDDIVLIVGKDETILGRQALKILNSIYQYPHKWYLTSNFIEQSVQMENENSSSVFNTGSHLRSFKQKLINSVPLFSLIDYKLDKNTGEAWPTFYKSHLNELDDYFQFKKIQKFHGGHLDQILILKSRKQQICSQERQEYHELLLNLKNQFKPITQIGEKAQKLQNDNINQNTMEAARTVYMNYFNCKKQMQKKRFYKKTSYNQNYINTLFGKSDKIMINLKKYLWKTMDFWKSLRSEQTKSVNDTIFTLTPRDLNKLIEKIDFWEYKEKLQSEIPYEILEFQFNPRFNISLPKLKYTYFHNDSQIEQYLKNIDKCKNIQQTNDINFNIMGQIFFSPIKQSALEAQLYYINKKYSINTKEKELPICIFSAERNIYKKQQYQQFFDSIERLNYSNYHIIYIDDASTDESAYKIYDLVNNNYPRIKNRMKIIHNLQGIKAMGNMYFWTQKFCQQNDIVVNIDSDDEILGTQALKILSSVYEDQNIWYAYSNYLDYDPKIDYAKIGYSSAKLKYPTASYRRYEDFRTSHIRTYRLKLMKAVPIYQFLHFHYNSETKIAWPAFQSLAHDTAQVYAHFQLAGDQRIKYIDDYLYAYYRSPFTTNCYLIHERFDEIKGSPRTPLEKLSSLNQRGKQISNDRSANDDYYYKYPAELSKTVMEEQCYKM